MSSVVSTGRLKGHRLESFSSALRTKSTQTIVQKVPVDEICPSPWQPRKHFGQAALASLAESLKVRQEEPIAVRANTTGTPHRYELIYGERRLRASRLAKLPTIDAIVRADQADDTAAVSTFVENLLREDLTLSETLGGLSRLRQQLSSQAAVARSIGKSKTWAARMFALTDAPDFVQELINDGYATDTEALYELARWAKADADAARAFVAQFSAEAAAGRAPGLRAGLSAARAPAPSTAPAITPVASPDPAATATDDEESPPSPIAPESQAAIPTQNPAEVSVAMQGTPDADTPREPASAVTPVPTQDEQILVVTDVASVDGHLVLRGHTEEYGHRVDHVYTLEASAKLVKKLVRLSGKL